MLANARYILCYILTVYLLVTTRLRTCERAGEEKLWVGEWRRAIEDIAHDVAHIPLRLLRVNEGVCISAVVIPDPATDSSTVVSASIAAGVPIERISASLLDCSYTLSGIS